MPIVDPEMEDDTEGQDSEDRERYEEETQGCDVPYMAPPPPERDPPDQGFSR